KRRPSLADEVKPNAAPVTVKAEAPSDDHMVKPAKLDPIGPEDFDLFKDVDKMLTNELEQDAGAHDFKALPEKAPAKKDDPLPAGAEIDRIEKELAEIRAAEEKIAQEDAKRHAVEEEIERQRLRKEFEERQKLEEDYR